MVYFRRQKLKLIRFLQIEQKHTTKINGFAFESKYESGTKINQADHANIESSEKQNPLGQQQENANEQLLENLETEQHEIGDLIVIPHNQNLEK